MSDIIREIEAESGRKLQIVVDRCPDSPRNWDNLGTIVGFHKRYKIGDDNHGYKSSDYDSWDEIESAIIKNEKPVVVLPVYMYDHSGQTISTSPFSCRWDSGQVGFIYVSREKALSELGLKRITGKDKERIENILKGEIATYDQYIRGDVYGFEIVDKDGNVEDSCYGFYGSNIEENGILDYVADEFKVACGGLTEI